MSLDIVDNKDVNNWNVGEVTNKPTVLIQNNTSIAVEDEINVEIIGEEYSKDIEAKGDVLLKSILNPTTSMNTIESVGQEDIRVLSQLSRTLSSPVGRMASDDETKKITTSLLDLKSKVEEINPAKFNFEPGFFGRALQKFGGGSTINKYVSKFESASAVINSISSALEQSRQGLVEDNAIFTEDRKRYREASKSLTEKVEILKYTLAKVEDKIAQTKDEYEKEFLEQEVQFTLSQQIIDLQQTLAATAQGTVAFGIIVKGNQELIRTIRRSQNVTVVALNVGSAVATGLAKRRNALKTVEEVTAVTNNILKSNAKMMREQGVEIQKQATSALLDTSVMQEALRESVQAINDLENFKKDSLPAMKESINTMNAITKELELKIQQMDKSERLKLQGETL